MIQNILGMLIDPRVWLLILVVTVVEASVGLLKFYIGRQGMVAVQKRFPKIKPEQWQRIDQWFKRWGALSLLLMAFPGLSTFLALAAGIYGYRLYTFVWWTSVAILGRNWLIVLLLFSGYKRLF